MPGYAGIKHHITQDELTRRRLSMQETETLRESLRVRREGAVTSTLNAGVAEGSEV